MRIPEGSGTISARLDAKTDGKQQPSGSGTVTAIVQVAKPPKPAKP